MTGFVERGHHRTAPRRYRPAYRLPRPISKPGEGNLHHGGDAFADIVSHYRHAQQQRSLHDPPPLRRPHAPGLPEPSLRVWPGRTCCRIGSRREQRLPTQAVRRLPAIRCSMRQRHSPVGREPWWIQCERHRMPATPNHQEAVDWARLPASQVVSPHRTCGPQLQPGGANAGDLGIDGPVFVHGVRRHDDRSRDGRRNLCDTPVPRWRSG